MSKIEHALKGKAVAWNAGELWLARRLASGPAALGTLNTEASAAGIPFDRNVLFTGLEIGAHLQQRPDKWALKPDALAYRQKRLSAPAAAPKPTAAVAKPAPVRIGIRGESERDAVVAAGFAANLAKHQAIARAQSGPVEAPRQPLTAAEIFAARRKQSGH